MDAKENQDGSGVGFDLRKQILNDPEFDQLLLGAEKYLKQKQVALQKLPDTQPQSSSKTITRRAFLGGILGLAGLAAASQLPNANLGSFGLNKPTATPSPIPTEIPATPEKPTNLFTEILKPFVEDAKKKRAERAKNDPEYSHRVDQELNENRLNFILFGYGEEHGETYEDYGGSISVLSYDLKTNKIAVVHLSRDIRAPELERRLPENQKRVMTIRSTFKHGGYPLLRQLTEDMTGLSADFQIILRDVVIRDMVDKLADGSLELNVLKDHDTGPFRLDREQFGEGYIHSGKQTMNTMEIMRYILAEDKDPQGKVDERSYRKNDAIDALILKMKNKLQKKPPIEKVGFLKEIFDLINSEKNKKNIEFEFDQSLLSKSLEGTLNLVGKVITNLGQNFENSFPETDKGRQLVFHDPSFGDGGVMRVHNIYNFPDVQRDNPTIVEEVKKSMETPNYNGPLPPWMLIPDGGDPYANDLVTDYWQSIRKMVKNSLQK